MFHVAAFLALAAAIALAWVFALGMVALIALALDLLD